MTVMLRVKLTLTGVWCMAPDRCRCSRAILRVLGFVIVLSGLLALPSILDGQAGKAALHLPLLAPQVAPAALPAAATETRAPRFRLIPDDAAALARTYFNQAQRELATENLANAQHEIERAVSFAELQCGNKYVAEDRDPHLAALREYYEWYIELLMQRQRRQPHGEFAALAWQANERLHWWLAQAAGTRPSSAPALTLTQLQQQLLDEQSLLLAYALGTERSYLWAIAKQEFTWFELPGKHAIEARVGQLYQWLSRQPEPAANALTVEADRLARELSALLLQPAAAQLRERRLLVVADGALQQLPFGVLPIPEFVAAGSKKPRPHAEMLSAMGETPASTPLMVQHEIVNWPSATTVWWMRQRQRRQTGQGTQPSAQEATVAVIADPVFGKYDERVLAGHGAAGAPGEQAGAPVPLLDHVLARLRNWDFVKSLKLTRAEQQILLARLPLARSEAEAIAGAAPRSVQWLDFAANRAAALRGLLADYPVIHFATHGFFNRRNPALSGLVLSQVNEQGDAINGLLLNCEIGALQLKAELVVVSACESALAETGGATAYNSLAHSFLQAGARRVVASLWKVNDAATAELMKRFYRQMFNRQTLKGKLASPAAALRAAQLEMWRESRWQRPFYWAAFVLQGEG